VKKLPFLILLLFTSVAASFGQTLHSITVTPPTARIVSGTQQFTANCFDTTSTPMTCPTLTWTSYMPSIATINSSGLATTVANGTAHLVVYAAGSHVATNSWTNDQVGASIYLTIGTPAYNLTTTIYTPTIAEPAKNAGFVDSNYDLTNIRLTDVVNDGGADTGSILTEYFAWDAVSPDGQYALYMSCASGSYNGANCTGDYALYNAVTNQFIANLTDGLTPYGCNLKSGFDIQQPEPRWDRRPGANPHTLTYRIFMELRQCNVDSLTDTLIHNFMNEFGPSGTIAHVAPANSDTSFTGYIVFNNEYSSWSQDGRYYPLLLVHYCTSPNCDVGSGGSTPYYYYYLLIYDRTNDNLRGYHHIEGADFANGGNSLKGIQISPLGDYVTINYFTTNASPPADMATNEYSGITSYPTTFSGNYVRISNFPDHYNLYIDGQGNEVAALIPSGVPYMEITRLDNGNTYQSWDAAHTLYYPNITFSSTAVHGWAFWSTYGAASFETFPTWLAQTTVGPSTKGAFKLDETRCLQWYTVFGPTPLNPTPSSVAYWSPAALGPNSCTSSLSTAWQIASDQNIYYGFFTQVNLQIASFLNPLRILWSSNWNAGVNTGPSNVFETLLPVNWELDLASTVTSSVGGKSTVSGKADTF
jgi:hypothetical protein